MHTVFKNQDNFKERTMVGSSCSEVKDSNGVEEAMQEYAVWANGTVSRILNFHVTVVQSCTSNSWRHTFQYVQYSIDRLNVKIPIITTYHNVHEFEAVDKSQNSREDATFKLRIQCLVMNELRIHSI